MSLIPDTLTIFITTKISNYQHFIYNSKNTITNTDNPLLFNPLVLLKNNISNPNILFNKNLFDKKLLEDKPEKLPTLIKATKDKYIDKNIKYILDVLFKSGEIIYLGDYPFTIFNMKWNNSWTIQHKPSYSLTNIKEFLLSNNNKTVEENNLLYSLPDEVRTNNPKDLYLQYLTNLYLLKGSIKEPITNKELTINDHDLGIYDVIKSIDINNLPVNLKIIINNYRSDYLIYISGLYFNLTTDPMILILFYTDKNNYSTPDEYLNIPKYIHENSEIEYVFQLFKEKRILFNSSQYNFWNIWKNLSYQQKKVEDFYKEISSKFKTNPNLSYYEVQNIMNNIENFQKEFYKLFILYFKSFLNVIQSQYSYYKSALAFLKKLNEHYSDNILSTPLNIENEHIVIKTDIKVFECIVKKFEDPYVPPLTINDKNLNIIKYYKKLYDNYLNIIFNLLKIKSVILFDKIKEDPDLTQFYILENYQLNLSIFSYYEYIKTYLFDCNENYKELFEYHSDKSIPENIRNKYLSIFNVLDPSNPSTFKSSSSVSGSDIDVGLGIKKKLGRPLVPSSVSTSSTTGKVVTSSIPIVMGKVVTSSTPIVMGKVIRVTTPGEIEAYKIKLLALEKKSKGDMDKLLKDIAGLRAIIDGKEKIEGKLKATLKKSEDKYKGVVKELSDLRDVNTALLGRLRIIVTQLRRTEDEFAATNTEVMRLQQQNDALRRHLDAIGRHNAEERRRLMEQIAATTTELTRTQQHNDALKRQVDDEKRQKALLEQRAQDIQQHNGILQTRLQQSRRDFEQLQQQYNDQDHRLEVVAGRLQVKDKEIKRLQQQSRVDFAENVRLQQLINQQQTQITALERVIANDKRQIDELRQTIEEKTSIITAITAENTHFIETLKKMMAENTGLKKENEALSTELEQFVRLNMSKTDKISALEQQIKTTELQLTQQQDDADKFIQDLTTRFQSEIEDKDTRIEELEKQLREMDESNSTEREELTDKITKLTKDKTALQTELTSKNKEVDQKNGVIMKSGQRIQQLTQELMQVFDEMSKSEKEFASIRQKLTSKNKTLEDEYLKVIEQNVKYFSEIKTLKLAISESSKQKEDLRKKNTTLVGLLRDTSRELTRIQSMLSRDEEIAQLQKEIEQLKTQLEQKKQKGGSMLTTLTEVAKNIQTNPITKYVDKIFTSSSKSIIDNYTISFIKNFELFEKLTGKYNNAEFNAILSELKKLKKLSKLTVKNEKVEFITFIQNNTLTYSMLILIVYAIQVVLFQYLNFNTSCMNYFMLQKEYSTFCYLYNELYYSKLKKNSLYSIPFTINHYTNINLQELQEIKVVYFKEIIFSNSLLCKYYNVYKELNDEINKVFYYINPSLNKQILIKFCNYSLFFFITKIIFDINNTLLEKCDFKNKINDISHFDFHVNDYEKTKLIQNNFLDIIDNGVFLKFLPKQQYVSVNNWYLKEIEDQLTFWNKNKEYIEDIIHQKQIMFKDMFDKISFTTNTNINNFIDFIFIYKEVKIFKSFEYLELLNTKENLFQNRLYNFYIFYYYLYENTGTPINFDFDITKKLINSNTDKDKLFLVISYLYNTIFPTYFDTNADNLLEIFTELLKSITYNGTMTDIYKIPFVDAIYNLYSSSNYISSNNLKNQETKLQEIISNIITTNIRYDNNIFNNNNIKLILNNINNLNVYCSQELIKQLLIVLIFLVKSVFQELSTKSKINMNITKPNIAFDNLNIFYYANMLDTSKYYYYILQQNNNKYKIGDEIFEKSSKKIYIILNKLVVQDNILFQIVESKDVNTINIKQFHNNVKVINSNDINSSYKIISSFSLDIKNKYLQHDIKQKIKFIYYDNKTNTTFYLNNFCLSPTFIYYRLILFNKINQLQYNPFVKQYSLNGFSNINLPEYYYFITQNKNNKLYKQSEYIKKQYQSIMYFHLITDANYTDVDINLLKLYNILKSSSVNLFDKYKDKIKRELLYRFSRAFDYRSYRGGEKEKKNKKEKKENEENEEKEDKIAKEELLGNSPFSYFIHIELDVLPGKHTDANKRINYKGITLNCDNKKNKIIESFDEIRNKPYKPKLLSSKYLLSQDPNFPVNKFFPEEQKEPDEPTTPKEPKQIKPTKTEEEEEEEEEPKEKSGGTTSQIPNLFHRTSFLNDYFTKTN